MGGKSMGENFVKSIGEERWVKNNMGENFVKVFVKKDW